MTLIRLWIARIRRRMDKRHRFIPMDEKQCNLMSYAMIMSEKRIPEELIIHG